ncbi:unnamed protein product [Hermetia illucens]|uniref:Uncharacterized protein n=1 Tax=Hermetia illucens TaxID=343691 RepID=A0A7R8YS21_HERIL|nr:unnamed protein product [Hermetia illucens]
MLYPQSKSSARVCQVLKNTEKEGEVRGRQLQYTHVLSNILFYVFVHTAIFFFHVFFPTSILIFFASERTNKKKINKKKRG